MQFIVNAVAEHGGQAQAAAALGWGREMVRRRYQTAMMNRVEATYVRPIDNADGRGLRILFIGDIHAPFQHKDIIPFLTAAKERFAPQRIVLSGDELDQHALSQYKPDPDGYSAGHELEKGLEFMQEMYDLFPIAAVCTSNHGARPFKRAIEAGIPSAYIQKYSQFMKSPRGWSWADRVEYDGVMYQHGEGYSGQGAAIKAARDNMMPTCIGHVHSFAGIQYYNNGAKQIWGFNAGCLIDAKAYAFAYGKNHSSKPVIGVGVIDKGVPMFCPMQMDASKRWTGQL